MTTMQAAMERERTGHYQACREIVEDIAADEEPIPWNPKYAELSCKYCLARVTLGFENHEQDCTWLRSKELVKENNK